MPWTLPYLELRLRFNICTGTYSIVFCTHQSIITVMSETKPRKVGTRAARNAVPGPGRPKDLAKRKAILEAAKGFFPRRTEEHTSELQPLMRISYAVFRFQKKNTSHIGDTA